jgi:hypothetical protein
MQMSLDELKMMIDEAAIAQGGSRGVSLDTFLRISELTQWY